MKKKLFSRVYFLIAFAVLLLSACSSKKKAILASEEQDFEKTQRLTTKVYDTSQTPIKTLRVAFHVFQHSSGEKSFTTNKKDLDFFRNTIERTNNLLSNLQPLEPLNSPEITSPYIKDARIRLLLDTVYFRIDDEIYNGFSKAGIVFQHAQNAHARHIKGNSGLSEIQKNKTLHVIVAGTWDTHGGQVSGLGNKDFILFKGWYDRFAQGHTDGCYHTFVHELGHSMGLHHQFAPHDCQQCKDLGCIERGETNNIMSLSPSKLNAVSLCQFEIVHEYLAGETGNIGVVVIENENQN